MQLARAIEHDLDKKGKNELSKLFEISTRKSDKIDNTNNTNNTNKAKLDTIREARNDIVHGNGNNGPRTKQKQIKWTRITKVTPENCYLMTLYLIDFMELFLTFSKDHIQKSKGSAAFNPFDSDLRGL